MFVSQQLPHFRKKQKKKEKEKEKEKNKFFI